MFRRPILFALALAVTLATLPMPWVRAASAEVVLIEDEEDFMCIDLTNDAAWFIIDLGEESAYYSERMDRFNLDLPSGFGTYRDRQGIFWVGPLSDQPAPAARVGHRKKNRFGKFLIDDVGLVYFHDTGRREFTKIRDSRVTVHAGACLTAADGESSMLQRKAPRLARAIKGG
jgi:hypothetical protein